MRAKSTNENLVWWGGVQHPSPSEHIDSCTAPFPHPFFNLAFLASIFFAARRDIPQGDFPLVKDSKALSGGPGRMLGFCRSGVGLQRRHKK